MKKRLLALVMALCMLIPFAVPTFAVSQSDVISGSDVSDTDVSLEDVQTVYDAYLVGKNALEGNSLDAVVAAVETLDSVADIFNEMDEAELAVLGEKMGCSAEDAYFNFLGITVDVNILNDTRTICEEYEDNPDALTALALVDRYDVLFNDPEYANEEWQELTNKFFPDFDDLYEEAKGLMPSQEVLDIYNAFIDLVGAISSNTLSEVVSATDVMDAVMDSLSQLDENQKKDAEDLFAEDYDSLLLSADYIYDLAKAIVTVGVPYEAYLENDSEENKKAFIDACGSVFTDEDIDFENRVSEFFFGLKKFYNDIAGVFTVRIAGESRTKTAAYISAESYQYCENIILASGDNYADALAGGALAYALEAPILLVRNSTLDSATLNEIARRGATNIYILGGELAIGKNVEDFFVGFGYEVERIAGQNRYQTAVKIADAAAEIWGGVSNAFFVTGQNYPDALAVSSIAGITGSPILYIAPDGVLDEETKNFVTSNNVQTATIIGGEIAISSDAEDNLKEAGINTVDRLFGTSRYDTCLEINKAYAEELWGSAVCVATGTNYPDALAGGVFAAINLAPIVLVGDELTEDQAEFITERGTTRAYIFGGEIAVSAQVEDQLNDLNQQA